MIELSHIHKYYNPGTVTEMCLFEDFSLQIEKGEFVSIVGSNGSGKTSLLNIICGSIPIERGSIIIDGRDITSIDDDTTAFNRNGTANDIQKRRLTGTITSYNRYEFPLLDL
jgi:putative ABC transport system ATP-binding protein